MKKLLCLALLIGVCFAEDDDDDDDVSCFYYTLLISNYFVKKLGPGLNSWLNGWICGYILAVIVLVLSACICQQNFSTLVYGQNLSNINHRDSI